MLTTAGANVGHRDEDGMTVLEHAEQNDRRQVVTLIKRAQLASQMRQRRKQKNLHKDSGLTIDEYERRELEAQARADELLAVCSRAGGFGGFVSGAGILLHAGRTRGAAGLAGFVLRCACARGRRVSGCNGARVRERRGGDRCAGACAGIAQGGGGRGGEESEAEGEAHREKG